MLDVGPFEAQFTATAATADSELSVTIPGFDDGAGSEFGPVVWQPGPGGALPAIDDRALVVRSDTDDWWVLQWVPS